MQTTTSSARRAGRLWLTGAATAAAALAATAIAFNAAGTGPAAQAATVTYDPLAPALGFNSFVEDETALVSTESEGGVATGGNLVVKGSYNVNIHDASTFTVAGDSRPSALVVGGRLDFGQDPATSVVQVHDYVKVGDLTGATVRNTDSNNASVNTHLVASGAGYDSTPRIELNTQQPLASVGPASPIDFDAAFTELRANARKLTGCRAHSVQMVDERLQVIPKGEVAAGQRITISGIQDGVTNILHVTGEDLNDMSELVFPVQPTETAPLLINVDTSGTGGEMHWYVRNQPGAGGGNGAPYILWNFGDTTRLTLTGGDSVEGSILAPDADYTDLSPSNVEGQIIAKNASHGDTGANGGEIHHFPFAAEIACEDFVQTTPASKSPDDNSNTIQGSTDVPSDDTGTTGGSGGPSQGGTDWTDSLAATGTSLRPLLAGAAALTAVGAAVVALTLARRRSTEH
ncbi:collagen-binding domain-containing protein [Glycomyces dulcitolivorans]|uniref:collagen-binding domain-containing protein n=1 Tax=Glycomyces dulcitolivorans TaxID=2200759 RepID=UPI0013008CE9|nr:choice-of-anchor A family protein [Glycomyces dulcitolivorans]